jgi:hypothetical protein
MNQTPETNPIDNSIEKETQSNPIDVIDNILVTSADEAEEKASTNPNVTAFNGWEETIPGVRREAMNKGAYSILKDILGESPDFSEDKVRQAAEDYVTKMVIRKDAAANTNESQFN